MTPASPTCPPADSSLESGAPVRDVCFMILSLRETGKLRDERIDECSRALALAAVLEVNSCASYIPDHDRRLLWGRAVVASAIAGREGKVDLNQELVARWLLGIADPPNTGGRGSPVD